MELTVDHEPRAYTPRPPAQYKPCPQCRKVVAWTREGRPRKHKNELFSKLFGEPVLCEGSDR